MLALKIRFAQQLLLFVYPAFKNTCLCSSIKKISIKNIVSLSLYQVLHYTCYLLSVLSLEYVQTSFQLHTAELVFSFSNKGILCLLHFPDKLKELYLIGNINGSALGRILGNINCICNHLYFYKESLPAWIMSLMTQNNTKYSDTLCTYCI